MGDASSSVPSSPDPSAPRLSDAGLAMRIVTHNIRYATTHPERDEQLWKDRFAHLSGHLQYQTRRHFSPPATFVCLQEVLHAQLQDLMRHTFTDGGAGDWAYVGVGRDDGRAHGEFSPIFFRRSAWNLLHAETVWLNETGAVGQKGWDAASVRILTCAVLGSRVARTDQPSSTSTARGPVMLALNTHLDDQGRQSRRESARVILDVAARLQARYAPSFTFLAGDLNSRPDGEAYQLLNARNSGFVDARRLIASDNRDGTIYAYGNEFTFTGFSGDAGAQGRERIDFVHLGVADDGDQGRVQRMVQAYGVLPNRFDDRVWMSDHRAVVVDLLIDP